MDTDTTNEQSEMVEIAYRIPGKWNFRKKCFRSSEAAHKFITNLFTKEGDDVEVRWGASQ